MKILTIDLETAPLEVYTWGTWDQNIGIEQIKHDRSILSVAAKWLDASNVMYADTSGRGPKKVRDDKKLCGGIWRLLNEADTVVAQNGVQFDIKIINARLITHGFGPYSPIRVVDTLAVAKSRFGFISNKLAWTSKLVKTQKDKHKRFPGFELWVECLNDNPAAWAEMKKYNVQDVRATEELYLKLRPWITSHPNFNAYVDSDDPVCPKCESDAMQMRGYAYTQAGKYRRFQCTDCGGWSRGKENLIPLSKRKRSLV
jgi:hypothetical protein